MSPLSGNFFGSAGPGSRRDPGQPRGDQGLQAPEIAIADAERLQPRDRVVQVLRPRAQMPAGTGQDLGGSAAAWGEWLETQGPK